jgi:hypothetical protein
MSIPAFLTKFYDLMNWPYWDIKICDGDRIIKTTYEDYFIDKVKIKKIGEFRIPKKGEYRVKNTRYTAYLQKGSYQPQSFEPQIFIEKSDDGKFIIADMTTKEDLKELNQEDLATFMENYKADLLQGRKEKYFYEQLRNVKMSPLFYEITMDMSALKALTKDNKDFMEWLKENWLLALGGLAVIVGAYYYMR